MSDGISRRQTGLRGLLSQPRFRAAVAIIGVIVIPWGMNQAVDVAGRRDTHPVREKLFAHLPKSVCDITPYRAVEAYPNLRFVCPLFIVEVPDDSGRLAVLERRGRILLVPKDSPQTTEKQALLDITDRVMLPPDTAEDGLLGLAFHPQYGNPSSAGYGRFFVHYTADVAGRRMNRLSRFTATPGVARADVSSEVVLIDQFKKSQAHNGGSVEFGPDGFLYLSLGDDEEPMPNPHGQSITSGLLAGILRIDVDCRGGEISHAAPRQPDQGVARHYFIPNDNPFVGMPHVHEEFFSIGLRNPWRMSFDRETDRLWVTDVGGRRREEVNIAFKGSNHQWAYAEGTLPTTSFDPQADRKPTPYLGVEAPPVYEYPRDSMNRCIIGGYVYRGTKLPELTGRYVFADQCGRIYALPAGNLDRDDGDADAELIAVVPDSGMGVSSLGTDEQGELYICYLRDQSKETGSIYRLEHTVRRPEQMLPTKLSETKLFADLRTLRTSAGLIPYEVNSPFWSDRAVKMRWIGFQSDAKISGSLDERWVFPAGTVFVKHFALPLDERAPAKKARRLETRVIVRDDQDGIYGAAYRWNAQETDATLVDFTETEAFEYIDAEGKTRKRTWMYPGRFECLTCHNRVAGGILGFSFKQLNRTLSPGDIGTNQVRRFAQAGAFAFHCPENQLTDTRKKLVGLADNRHSVERRVRSYLDANCSHCHQHGLYFGAWDARADVPFGEQGILNGKAHMHGPDTVIVRPGDIGGSILYSRITSNEPHMRMPPLASSVVDEQAAKLIAKWIDSLSEQEVDEQSDRPAR